LVFPHQQAEKFDTPAQAIECGSRLCRSEMVPNVQGDEIWKIERIDFIKCDVEGAEVAVFRSMPQVIARHEPVLLLEWWIRRTG
jgi:FkbM family methyltransferase